MSALKASLDAVRAGNGGAAAEEAPATPKRKAPAKRGADDGASSTRKRSKSPAKK
jgi:hypothetical protein